MQRSRYFRISLATLAISLLLAFPPFSAQADDARQGIANASSAADSPVVSVTAEFAVSPGNDAGHLAIMATIAPTWHIYSCTQPPGGPVPTKIEIFPSDAFRLTGDFRASPAPDRRSEPAFGGLTVETHHDQVLWRAPIVLAPGVDRTAVRIAGLLKVQACGANNCLPPRNIPFTAVFAESSVAPEQAPAAAATPSQTAPEQTTGKAGAAPAFDPDAIHVSADVALRRTSQATIMVFGFLGGLLLNLMPCVLPVVGLKILAFAQQAGQARRQALLLNVWYSLGLLSVFMILASLAVFVGLGWGQLFSFAGFNIALIAVVFAMSLSFLGIWEIPIPGIAGSGKVNGLSEQEGAVGAFAKGVMTTVLATPCSGPFLASALAWSVGQPPARTYAVFASVGVGMASPYLAIGAFPALLRFLPKPGAWMETFRQLMGFVLLGTVVYLLTLLEWIYVVPTVAFLFGLWAACWWIGRTPLMSDRVTKARAWLSAAAFAGVVWLVTFGWLADVMAERFQRTMDSAHATAAVHDALPVEDESQWLPYTRERFDRLVTAQKTVLIDFTADWCMTCKTLEKLVLNTAETREAVRRNGVVTLQADWTHASPEVTEMLDALGSKQVPVIAIFPAGDVHHPIVLRGGCTQQTLTDALDQSMSRFQDIETTHCDRRSSMGRAGRQ